MLKNKLQFSAILFSVAIATDASAAGSGNWFTNSVASAGDFLSSWGRGDANAAPQGTVPPPTLAVAGDAGNDCNKAHQAAMEKKAAENEANDKIKPNPKGIGEMPCFDKYKNFSFLGGLGVPDFAGLLDQLKGQACSYADQQVAAATAPINQSVWLPGGAGRVNTGVVFGQQAGTPPVQVSKTTTGISLPNIFKP